MSLFEDLLDSQETELSFYYGEEKISFYRRRAEAVERLTIEIDIDQRITVHVPLAMNDVAVIEAVKRRARWIYQQLSELKQQTAHITPRHYISGESHFYLGRRYQLKIFPLEAEHQNTNPTLCYDKQIRIREREQCGRDLSNDPSTPITDLFDPAHIAMVDELKRVETERDTPLIHDDLNPATQKHNPQESVQRRRNLLEIYAYRTDKAHIAALLQAWYRSEADLLFHARLMKLAQQLSIGVPRLTLRWMQQQWSLFDDKHQHLTLNIHLIKADQEIIDYIILCELLRLMTYHGDQNHYLPLLRRYCPKWRAIHARLEKMSGYYLQ